MSVLDATLQKEYKVRGIKTSDEELVKFLFSLGCYEGENITVIAKKRKNLILAIKDARYNIDSDLAKAILI